jgi:hypothetical protein
MDWADLAQDRDHWWALESTVINLRVPLNAGIFLSSCTTGGFSRRAHLHAFFHITFTVTVETSAVPLAAVRSNLVFTLDLWASFARLRFSGSPM